MLIDFRQSTGGGSGPSISVEAITVTENKVYTAPSGTAYSPVDVQVPIPEPKLQEKTATVNGSVTPDPEFDGLSKVTVNVPQGSSGPIRLVDHLGMKLGYSTFSTFTNEDFDFSGVTRADYMFKGCGSLQSLPEGIDFSYVQNANHMFDECYNLTSLPEGIDFSSVQQADTMFNSCSELTTIPAYNFSNVINANYMFLNCMGLESLPEGIDFSSVQQAVGMFGACNKLTTIPAYNFSSVQQADGMFENMSELTSLPEGIDFSSVQSAANMFGSCSKLTTIPNSFSSLEFVSGFVSNCTSLTSLPKLNFGKVQSINYFFGWQELPNLTDLGGFTGLKVDWNDEQGLNMCPNLTKQSVLNVINELYDFRANGDDITTKTIKFHPNSLALLSEEEKAIATNKGWNLI